MRLSVLLLIAGCGRIGFDSATSDAPTGATDGPLGASLVHLDCDAFSGSTLRDLSNHGNDATCAGPCPALVPGKHGNACSFDGTEELDIPSFTMVQAVAIAAWVRMDTDSTSIDCAINRGVGSAHLNSWQLCVEMGGNVYFGTDGDDDYVGILTLGTWHHIVLDFDGMTKRTFLDGVLQIAHPAVPTSYDGSPVRIGFDNDDGLPAFPFHGLLDDIYIFDRTLSSDEIAALSAP